MTLEWTTIDVPLGAGIDTKTNEKLLKPPACADLSDAVFPATGVSGYETRKGYDRIRTETTLTGIDALATAENELLVVGNDKLYSVSELENNVDLVEKGNLLAVGVNQETLDTQSVNQTLGQYISHNNVECFVWYDSGAGNCRYTVRDTVTGTMLVRNSDIANSTRAKVAYAGNSILIIYFNSSATSIRCTVIPTYAPTSPSDVEVRADAHADAIFDCIETISDKVFVAYKSSTGTASIWTFLLDDAGDDSSATEADNSSTRSDVDCLCASRSGFSYIVATSNGVNVYIYTNVAGSLSTIRTFSRASQSAPNVINIAYLASTATTGNEADHYHYAWAEYAGSTNRDNYVEQMTALGSSFVNFETPTETHQHSSIASTPFFSGDIALIHYSFDTTLQRQYLLVNSSGETQAKSCVGIGGGNIAPHLPRVINNTWAPVFREKLDIDVEPDDDTTVLTDVYAQYGLKKVSYDFTHRPQYVEYGHSTYIQSGVLWQYDGAQLVEQGFHVYPEAVTSATQAGSIPEAGDYSYRVYYEWTNARGERQRSTTAQVETVTVAASEEVVLTIPTLSHSLKGADVAIVVYRSEANPNLLGGSPLYRVSSPDPSATGDNGYVANDPTTPTVTFTDSLADSALIQKELDYLNVELDHVAAPVSSVLAEAKSRVWVAEGTRLYYSKLNTDKRRQLEFHDTSLWVDVPEEVGDITAFGSLNFHVVAFGADSCYSFSGEGKNNSGAGFFNLPQVVSLDVGCIEPRSVVNIPEGILFKSNKGIWRLGHNLDMVYVGANVEAYNDQDITSATLIPEENHVLFLTSSGRTLVYNYLLNAWSTFTNHAGNSAVVWNGSYTYARTDGRIYRQSDVNYSDDGVHYAMKFVTAPIGIKGVQGKQRIRHIRLLGEYYSPHTLRVGLRFNHTPGVTDSGTWDPADAITVSLYGVGAYGAGAYGGDGSPVYQARFNMPRQKCQTVQFVIDSTNTGGAGRAVSIQAIQIEVGAKRGTGELSVDAGFSATGGSTD